MKSIPIDTEVVAISKIRFGDPVTALGIGPNSILHGSIMGRLVHYTLDTKMEREVADMSNEMVRDITVSPTGTYYYIANGDVGWHVLAENGLSPLRTIGIEVHGSHVDICERSFTFQCKGYNCIIVLSSEDEASNSIDYFIEDVENSFLQGEDKIVLSHLETQTTQRFKNENGDLLQFDSIPCDFDGERILYNYNYKSIDGCKSLQKETDWFKRLI